MEKSIKRYFSSLLNFTIFCYVCFGFQKVQELEATLYVALQQDPDSCLGESLSDRQREKLAESMDAVRRQILRQSRHADTLVLQQRMELLQSAQQVRLCVLVWKYMKLQNKEKVSFSSINA